MTSILMVAVSGWSKCRRPLNGTITSSSSSYIYYTPDVGFAGVETITYTIRDNEGLTATGTLTVWVDPGSASAAQSPDLADRLLLRLSGFLGRVHHRPTPRQRRRPQRSGAHRRRSVGTLQQRHPHGHPVDGYTYTPGLAANLVGTDIQLNYLVTDTDGHVTQGTITIRILAANDTNQPPGGS